MQPIFLLNGEVMLESQLLILNKELKHIGPSLQSNLEHHSTSDSTALVY